MQEYPKYKYHKDRDAVLVHSRAEEDQLQEGFRDVPHTDEYPHTPFGAEADDLSSMSRIDLVEYARLNHGLALKADMPREKLQAEIEKAAKAHSQATIPAAPKAEDKK